MNHDDTRDLLLEEFRQAWAHYRHVENGRPWMLGFLYTLTLAGIGGIWQLLNFWPSRLGYFTSLFPALVIGLLALTTYVRLKRQDVVLSHYEQVWRWVRCRIYGARFAELNVAIDVRENPSVTQFFSSETVMTTLSIWLAIVISGIYLGAGIFNDYPTVSLSCPQRICAALMLLVLAGSSVFVLISVAPSRVPVKMKEQEHQGK